MLNHNARPAQISPAIYVAEQRSAVRCRAVRWRALPCTAVLCRAALCFLSNIRQCQVYVLCTRLFAFSLVDLSRSPCVFPPANYTSAADQNVTPPINTQHSTGQLYLHKQLLALSISCSHQIMGPFFLPPLHVLVEFFLARAWQAESAARGAQPL